MRWVGVSPVAIVEPQPVMRTPHLTFRSGRATFVLAVLILLFCSLPTASHAESQGSDKECNANNARPITVAEASLRIGKLEQACVQINGISDGRALYGSLGDIYRDTEAWEDHRPKQSKLGRIGLRPFPDPDDEDGHRPESGTWNWGRTAPHRVTLIGRLHDCGLDWSRGDPASSDFEIRMGTGWCHNHGGAVLRPVAIVAEEPAVLVRMTGRRAWRQFGDIAPVRQDSALTANAVDYVHRLFLAAHKGDRRTLLDLYGYSKIKLRPDGRLSQDNNEYLASKAEDLLDLWFNNPGTVMSQTAQSAAPPSIRLYEPRWKEAGFVDFWACWATTPLSDREGPISSIDTDNIAGRPYGCVELFMGSDRSVSSVALSASGWAFKARSD